jgi:hypothetical protein
MKKLTNVVVVLQAGTVFRVKELVAPEEWRSLSHGERAEMGRQFSQWAEDHANTLERVGLDTRHHQVYRKIG